MELLMVGMGSGPERESLKISVESLGQRLVTGGEA